MTHGTGATHLGIALANYCRSRHHAKTAYLEVNDSHELCGLWDTESQSHFSIYGVDYFSDVALTELSHFYTLDYQYLILDFGIPDTAHYQDFLRCDRKLVLGSLSPWKKNCFEEFFKVYQPAQQPKENLVYLALFGNRADLFDFSCSHHLPIRAVPFIVNPFQLETNLFSFLENLI